MKLKFILLFNLSLLLINPSFGQQFIIPADYQPKAKEDYIKYESQILEATNWLENTPLNKHEDQRKEISAFFLKWITGSPTISIEFNNYVTELSTKNPELLVIFLAGWTKYALQHPGENDLVKLNTEGLKAMLKAYKNGGAVKDKKLDKLVETMEQDGLEKWVKRKIA